MSLIVACVRRRCVQAALPWLVLCVVTAPPLPAQSAVGSVEGTVRSAQGDVPLPYAVVRIPALSLERFSDSQGRFSLDSIRAGTHDVVIRRIGYVTFRGAVQVDSGVTATLAATLQQVPVVAARMVPRTTARCLRPGVPDARVEPELSVLVGLLRENAERYRLLASQYPFIYLQIRAIGEMGDGDMFISRIDTLLVKSGNRSAYAPGKVVSRAPNARGGSEYSTVIPTIVDLADDLFIQNHCFAFAGTVKLERETWVRIDVRAADRLSAPDVDGSFFLDSATAQLRRMTLSISRPGQLPTALRSIGGVVMVTSFLDVAEGLAVIDKVCAVSRSKSSRARPMPVTPAELQQLLVYEFTVPPPDLRKRGTLLPPNAWRAGARLERKHVWCAVAPR